MSTEIKIAEVDALANDDHQHTSPLYVMVAGGMGVGKSFVIEKYIDDIKLFDIDLVMDELGYGDYTKEHFNEALQLIAADIDLQFADKESMIAMGTASNLTQAINRLYYAKSRGYRTVLIHIYAPIEQAHTQNKRRLTLGEHGVSEEDSYKIARTIEDSSAVVETIKHTDLVDYYVSYDNTRVVSIYTV